MKYFFLLPLLFLFTFSYACDCDYVSIEETYIDAEAIFIAEVIKVHYSDSDNYLIEVQPIEVFKGEASNTIIVSDSYHEDNNEVEGSCDMYIHEGERWIFFSNEFINQCSKSSLLNEFSNKDENFVRSNPKIEDIINEIVFNGYELDNGREVFSKLDSSDRMLIFQDKKIEKPVFTHGLVIVSNNGSIEDIKNLEVELKDIVEKHIENITLPIGIKNGFKVRYQVLMEIIIEPENKK